MAESKIYGIIRRHCKGIFFKRVENTCNIGTPDSYFAYGGSHGVWMEAKEIHIGSRDRQIRVPFRPTQFMWLKDNTAHGGHSLLAMTTEQGLFFAYQKQIQEVYERQDFIDALDGRSDVLTHVKPKNLQLYLQSLCNKSPS